MLKKFDVELLIGQISYKQKATTKKIDEMNIIVDKMHMVGHVDSWCKQHCDSRKYKELDKV